MKTFIKILAFLLIFAMMATMLVACNGDKDPDPDNDSNNGSNNNGSNNNGSNGGSNSGGNNPVTPTKAKYTVEIKDEMTGLVIQKVTVMEGYKTLYTSSMFTDLHYGYELILEATEDEKKDGIVGLKEACDELVYEDKTITAYYRELPECVVTLQKKDGSAYTEYVDDNLEDLGFYRRLTREQIRTNKNLDNDTLIGGGTYYSNKYPNQERNDRYWSELESGGQIVVYKGQSISYNDIPDAPVTADTFDQWLVVNDGETGDAFKSGSTVTDSIILRANYIIDGITIFNSVNLANYNQEDDADGIKKAQAIFAALKIGDNGDTSVRNVTNEYNGNEIVKFADETTAASNEEGTTFRFVHKAGLFLYCVDATMESTDENAVNQFTGKKLMDYASDGNTKAYNIQIDQNTYIAYDGHYLYAYLIVRDETVQYFTDHDTQVVQDKIEQDKMSGSLYSLGDGLEIRFFFGEKKDIMKWQYGESILGTYLQYGYQGAASNLRCISLDRKGVVRLDHKDKENNDLYRMYNYVDIIDINPTDNTRNTLEITNSSGNSTGYVVGMRFDIDGYANEYGYDWDASGGFFKVVLGVQVNDRVKPINELGTSHNYYDGDGNPDAAANPSVGLISGGVQSKTVEYNTITISDPNRLTPAP